MIPSGISEPPHFAAMAAAGGEFTGRRSFTFDERVAYHEAGHALASRVCYLPIAGASILFTNGHHGAVWSDDRSDTVETSDIVAELRRLMPGPFEGRDAVAVDLLDCQDHIVSLLAGRESELLFTGQALERHRPRSRRGARPLPS
jgi:hypothetical protein